MTIKQYREIVGGQFSAALDMLDECLRRCPAKHWKGKVGKYPFWQVAYHALYCTDLYTAPTEKDWSPGKFQPGGIADVENEYPTREFSKRELRAYVKHCRKLMWDSLAAETEKSLVGPSGFSWLKMTRAEVPIYSMRHVQHHTGQLGVFLRREKVSTKWSKRGSEMA